ncbi:hypothetical protein ACFFX0_01680 [Citricoccus parietis]|uniref:Uncharacterized protein n=1 Tax=Citricoccus parietis TaxID=592307 RepID=A0ABV5FUM5_9MICC
MSFLRLTSELPATASVTEYIEAFSAGRCLPGTPVVHPPVGSLGKTYRTALGGTYV